MPPDTLEELRLLYNLQVGNAKLMQIVLFGQPELNAKLDQPNMRQLKDRIAHHFHMQPLSRNILENYLMFRMRAAGYHGPNIFSPGAIKLIASASDGLMRRVNILADKSLLAAFVDDTYYIKPEHVQAALRDSELNPSASRFGNKPLLGGAAAAVLLLGLAAWWLFAKPPAPPPAPAAPPPAAIATPPNHAPAVADSASTDSQTASSPAVAANPPAESAASPAGNQKTKIANAAAVTAPAPAPPRSSPKVIKTVLFDQRLKAGKQLLEQKKTIASIQLYYNLVINPERIEGFLERADKLGVLPEIYLLPAKLGGKNGIRVLYGAYPSVEKAHEAVKDLPARYQKAFATSTYIF
jgi:MSHA biogenesis protein MshM